MRSLKLLALSLLAALVIGCGDDNGGSTTPARSGQSALPVTITTAPSQPEESVHGFDFAAAESMVGTLAEPAGDIYFLMVEGEIWTNVHLHATGVGGVIQVEGIEFDCVAEAPSDGYSASIWLGGQSVYSGNDIWSELWTSIGRVFCVRTSDGSHYGKIRIAHVDFSTQEITFDWVYLPEGGRVFP